MQNRPLVIGHVPQLLKQNGRNVEIDRIMPWVDRTDPPGLIRPWPLHRRLLNDPDIEGWSAVPFDVSARLLTVVKDDLSRHASVVGGGWIDLLDPLALRGGGAVATTKEQAKLCPGIAAHRKVIRGCIDVVVNNAGMLP